MKKLSRIIAIAVLALSIGSGVASAATGTIGNTGPNSNNQVTVNGNQHHHLSNTNYVHVKGSNMQTAYTGDVSVSHNTTGGSAMTGYADNSNSTGASLSISNASSSSAVLSSSTVGTDTGTVNTTGPSSNNQIVFNNTASTTVNNHNTVNVDNHSTQTATSGDAHVMGNTTAGSATTGDATNVNTSQYTLTLSN